MAISEAAGVILKRLAGRIASDALTARDREGKPVAVKIIAAACAAILLVASVPVVVVVSGGSSLVSAIEALFAGDDTRKSIEDALDTDLSVGRICAYQDEVKELESWASRRWSSGTGEDIYHIPSWRYLYAFDMAMSASDEALVDGNAMYYRELHKGLLKATTLPRLRVVPCLKTDTGAYCVIGEEKLTAAEYDELCARIKAEAEAAAREAERALREQIYVPEAVGEDLRMVDDDGVIFYWDGGRRIGAAEYAELLGAKQARDAEIAAALAAREAIHVEPEYTYPEVDWVRDEEYWIWCVTYTPLKKAFSPRIESLFSEEYRAFAMAPGGEYGTCWKNGGDTCGLYGIGYGAELDGFLRIAKGYEGLSSVSAWADDTAFGAGAEGFAQDWRRAFEECPQEMIYAQDRWYSATYAVPAERCAREAGLEPERLRDATRALLAQMYRQMGHDALLAALTQSGAASAKNEGILLDMLFAIAGHFEEEGGHTYALRRLAILAKAELANPPAEDETVSSIYYGEDHDAETDAFDLETKAVLSARYMSILKAVEVSRSWWYGVKKLTFDRDVFMAQIDRPIDGENDIVEVAIEYSEDDTHGYSQSHGMDGGAGRCMDPDVDCSSFVYYVLLEIGYTKDQLGSYPFTTRTMGRLLVAAGFEELEFTGFDDCEYGDILVRHGDHAHTEIVSGDWETVGAHDNYDGLPGDSSGNEVSVIARVKQDDWAGAKIYRRVF